MNNHPAARRPIAWLLAGSVLISFAPNFIRLADVSPDAIGFYRMLFASLALILLVRLGQAALRMQRTTLMLLVAGGVFLSVDFMCWHRSILLIGPGLSTLLANFQVFFTALFSWLLFKERLSILFMVAVLIAMSGMLLITGLDFRSLSHGYTLGIALALATAFFYSGYLLLIKRALSRESLHGSTTLLVVSVTCTLFFAVVTPLGDGSFVIPDISTLAALVGVGVLCTAIGWSIISTALKHTTATLTGLILLLQPALAFVWDVLFFSRPTHGSEVLGVLMILSAIYLGSQRRPTTKKAGQQGPASDC